MRNTTITKDYKVEITDKLIKALEKGSAPWQQTWSCESAPVNAVTGRYYQGTNSMILWYEAKNLSSDGDFRWATRNQVEKKGWRIKSGSRPVRISIMIIPDEEEGVKQRPIRKTFEVYHASQICGMPKFIRRKNSYVMSNNEIEEIIYNSSARIFEGNLGASYSPREDLIRMPRKSSFEDTEGYYSTLLHELAHWTGHETRLERFYSWSLKRESKESYAREELIAEIASMFLSFETGISLKQDHFDNHAAYISSWISLLKSDPEEIFRAAREATKATNYILAFREVKKIEGKKVV